MSPIVFQWKARNVVMSANQPDVGIAVFALGLTGALLIGLSNGHSRILNDIIPFRSINFFYLNKIK